MSKECVFFAQATADSTSLSDSYSEVSESEQSASKRKRRAKRENYLAGKSRKVYKLSKDLEKSLEESEGASGACSSCASSLARIADGFKQLKQQGSELRKRKKSLPTPKVANRDHYRNVKVQNEWIRANLFDSMGNCLFCHGCIIKALSISPQRLSRQRKVKRSLFQKPVVPMTKNAVNIEKLNAFVVMPEGIEVSIDSWWASIPDDHVVNVRYPHGKHGLEGKVSNNAKTNTKEAFLEFVDNNCQPNGRRLDSRNPTHYFFPKFKTISAPKSNAVAFTQKNNNSLVCEFNRTQREKGGDCISSQTVLNWLKLERPKVSIYPHQSDYCDTCSKIKIETHALQQRIYRTLQSGNALVEDVEELKKSKEALEQRLQEHRAVAKESLECYRKMKEKCSKQWKEISDLEKTEPSVERNKTLQQLQSTFTLLLSADYQMSKLLPYWGHTAQPSSTYYLQKVSYDIYGIVDHRDGTGNLYLLNETAGPKNTDHSISYLLHYLKSSGRIPSWVRRVHVFMDNAGSTNKNQFMMAAVLEVVQQNILDYFRISFMVAGHTKFAPDQLFAITARDFYSSDIFNERELTEVMQRHASVMFDSGRIVRCWRDVVSKKYSNLPGIRELHDFLALRNAGENATMMVRDNCYSGPLKTTPMSIRKGLGPQDRALPGVGDLYFAKGLVKTLSEGKQSHLNQMNINFIPESRRHELFTL